jgi:predicted RNase H-like HicB family nuclease
LRYTYTVVLVPSSDGGYVVEVPALPGCLTQGDTFTEALLMAEDAVTGYLEVLREHGDSIPREHHGVTVDLGRKREGLLRRVTVTLGPEVARVA